jgi:hypothetical protein
MTIQAVYSRKLQPYLDRHRPLFCSSGQLYPRNPQKHGFTDDFRTYPYSSYQTIRQQKQSRIEHQQVLQWFGSVQSFENYHQQFDNGQIQHLIGDDNFN